MMTKITYRFLLFSLVYFILNAPAWAQDSTMLSKIKAFEDEYSKASFRRKAVIELMLSEYYWQVQPEKGAEYGRKAIQSYRKIKNDSLGNAYVNTAICFYYLGEIDSCIAYTEEMLSLPNIHLTTRRKGISNNILCIAYRKKGDYEKGIKRGEQAIAYFREYGDSIQIAGTLDNMSLIFKKWGKYEEALEYSISSLKIFESMKDTFNMAMTLGNIGNLYIEIQDYENALKYLFKVEKIAKKLNDYVMLADVITEIGVVYKRQNRLDEADSLFKKSLQLYKQIMNNNGIATSQENIGSIEVEQGRCKEGLRYLRESLKFFKRVNSIEDISNVYIDMSKAFMCMQHYDSSVFYLNKALKNGVILNNAQLKLKSYRQLNNAYYAMQDFNNAYKIQKSYYQLKDSLQSVDVEIRINELLKKYNVEKVQKEAELYKSQKQVEESRNRFYKLITLSLVLFIILASYFVWQRRKKDREIIRLRQERNQIVKEEMEAKMHYQSKQLTTHALNMLQKNLLLQSLEEDMAEIRKKAKDELKQEIHSLNHKIKTHLKGEKDWDLFKMYFEQINKDFFPRMKDLYPNLTSNDLRLIALIKLNMNIKEVASVLNLSPDSVKNARYRLRKKLKLDSQDDLFEFINSIR